MIPIMNIPEYAPDGRLVDDTFDKVTLPIRCNEGLATQTR
jgi:hypothetical protein